MKFKNITRFNLFKNYKISGPEFSDFAAATKRISYVMISLQFSGFKNRPSKAWQSHGVEKWGHRTDSKPASVLANKPQ